MSHSMIFRLTAGLALAAALGQTASAQNQAFAYVPNLSSANVTVIDTVTDTAVATIPVGFRPQGVTVHPDGSRVYVANRDDDTLSVIDTADNTVLTTLAMGQGPIGMDVHPDGSKLYVAHYTGDIKVINTMGNSVITTVSTGGDPWAIAVHPGGSMYYVTIRSESRVSVRSTSNSAEIASITVGAFPNMVAVNPQGTRVYVTNSSMISVIDASTNTVIGTKNIGLGVAGVAVHPSGTRYYVAHDAGLHEVRVYDGLTDVLIAQPAIGLGASLSGLAVHPDGSKVYVNAGIGNRVDILDTATNTFVGSVPAGANPVGFGKFVGPIVCDPASPLQARVCFRTGGNNPTSYTASTAVIGNTFTATVDNNIAGQTTSFLVGFRFSVHYVLPGGQALLCYDPVAFGGEQFTGAGLFPASSAGGIDTFSLPVANDPGLVGLNVYSQAIQMGSGGFTLSNAQDLVVGAF